MNHKRRRPANRRAGCKLCKPWKINGAPVSDVATLRANEAERVDRKNAGFSQAGLRKAFCT